MSVLLNHAIRYEWLEQGRNPITLVRQSAQRKWAPEILYNPLQFVSTNAISN